MMAAWRKAKLGALALIVALAAGCAAPTQKLSDEDRARVKAARINDKVEKVPQVFLMAPSGANIGLMFGPIGGAVTGSAMEQSQNAFLSFLDKNSISIEKIVREEVELALRGSGKLSLAPASEGAAPAINIAVQQYGFGVTHLLSSNVVPVLMIKCDLVDASGKVLWSAGDRMLPSVASPMQPTSWEAMRDNPRLIEEQWRKASRFLADKIMSEL